MYLIAIETSCDETAVAILQGEKQILVSLVSSQIATHQLSGGVIPEIASRLHIECIASLLQTALQRTQLTMEDMSAVAVTIGPGLIGCLHVGVMAAKTLAWYWRKPLIAVNHLQGHVYAAHLEQSLVFPAMALIVSGGHSEIVYLDQHLQFTKLATTLDDAVGEAYDKVARILGLSYPGGPAIDRLARTGIPRYSLPKPKTTDPLSFSFSGIKSAMWQLIQRGQRQGEVYSIADLAASFQEAVLGQIIGKLRLALQQHPSQQLIVAGGVAANSRLRELVQELASEFPQLQVSLPPIQYCTDNAAMIAAVAYHQYQKSSFAPLSRAANPNLSIVE